MPETPELLNLNYEGRRYQLNRVIFHSPAEHRIGQDRYDLEIQLEHQAVDDSQRLNVALFFNEGRRHKVLSDLVSRLPNQAGFRRQLPGLDFFQLLTERQNYFRYNGSLTYPPCEEGVLWVLLSRPGSASRLQIDRIATLIDGKNRPVQPLHKRVVLEKL